MTTTRKTTETGTSDRDLPRQSALRNAAEAARRRWSSGCARCRRSSSPTAAASIPRTSRGRQPRARRPRALRHGRQRELSRAPSRDGARNRAPVSAPPRDHPDRRARASRVPRQQPRPLLPLQARAVHPAHALAGERGFAAVADGSNADDRGDYRPGRRAAREFGVISPLDEAGLTKDDIRALSREAGLPTWDEPASACLSSRIPYLLGSDRRKLQAIEQAEDAVRALGLSRAPRPPSRRGRAHRGRARRDGAALDPEVAGPSTRAPRARLPIRDASISRATGSAASTKAWPCGRSSRSTADTPSVVHSRPSALPVMARTRRLSFVLSLAFLAAHAVHLPRTLEDIDSINFAMGVESFDVAAHRPHPPGYPVFMALSKASTTGRLRCRPGWDRERRRCGRPGHPRGHRRSALDSGVHDLLAGRGPESDWRTPRGGGCGRVAAVLVHGEPAAVGCARAGRGCCGADACSSAHSRRFATAREP